MAGLDPKSFKLLAGEVYLHELYTSHKQVRTYCIVAAPRLSWESEGDNEGANEIVQKCNAAAIVQRPI